MKSLFVAATRQNDGKTSVALGLFASLQRRFSSLAYMKPVGQQYRLVEGQKIDKDAVLFKQVYALSDALSDMSPIAVPPGFTENYIANPCEPELKERVSTAFNRLSAQHEMVLVEGTGHGGVGAVFDLSNADVASMLGSPVVLVTLGGIGKAMDEILLNKAFFESRGCRIAGVIINKVQMDKWDKIQTSLSKSLARHDLPLLGMVPYIDLLTRPTLSELYEGLDSTLLCGEAELSNRVHTCVIGAMLPHHAMEYFTQGTLLIVPSNREDLIITALCGRMFEHLDFDVSGIVLTGGVPPHAKILNLVEQVKVPMLLVEEDSFTVATQINRMLVKLRAEESEKLATIQSLVETHVDMEALCGCL